MKISSIALLAAMAFPICAVAQSLGDVECDISELLRFSFNTDEVAEETCQEIRGAPKEYCSDKHIYPVMSGHPEDFIQRALNAQISEMAQFTHGDKTYVDAYTEVKFNKHNLFSVSHRSESYSAQIASSQSLLKCATSRLDTGIRIGLIDILVPEYATSLPSFIRKNIAGKLGAKTPKYVQNVLLEQNEEWQISESQQFYLTEEDLVLCYDEGSLTEKSKGTIEVTLPYSSIRSLISDTGALAFARGSKPDDPFVSRTKIEQEKISDNIVKLITGSSLMSLQNTMPEFVENQTVSTVQPASPKIAATPENEDFGYSCIKNGSVHRIIIQNYTPDSPHICKVHYYKNDQHSVLWQSLRDKAFCERKARELVSKYENVWNWTCTVN